MNIYKALIRQVLEILYFQSNSIKIFKHCYRGFSEVFASCADGEIRIWNIENLRELLRIELAKTEM
jgi:hypothetical protein